MAQKQIFILLITVILAGVGCSNIPSVTPTSPPTAIPLARITERPTLPSTPTIIPTATRTPRPTETGTPSPSNTPLPTKTETETPTSTDTSTPTSTPVSTDTPESNTVESSNILEDQVEQTETESESAAEVVDEDVLDEDVVDEEVVAEIVAVEDATLFTEPNPENGEEARLGYFIPADEPAQVVAISEDENWLEVIHPIGGRGWVSVDRFDLASTELATLPVASQSLTDEPIRAIFEIPDVPPTATTIPSSAQTNTLESTSTPTIAPTVTTTPTSIFPPTATLIPTIPPTPTGLPTITPTATITPTSLPPTITPTVATIPTAFPTAVPIITPTATIIALLPPTAVVTPTATLLPTITPTVLAFVDTPTAPTFSTPTPPPIIPTILSTVIPPTLAPTAVPPTLPPTAIPPTVPPPPPAPNQNASGIGIYDPPPNSIAMTALGEASVFVRQNPRREGDHTGYGVPVGGVVYAVGKGEQSYWIQMITPGRNGAADAIYGWVSSGLFDISRGQINALPPSGFVVQGYPEIVPTQSFGRPPADYAPPVDEPIPSFVTITPIGYVAPPPTDTPLPTNTPDPNATNTPFPTSPPQPTNPQPTNPQPRFQPTNRPQPPATVNPGLPPEELARATAPPPPDVPNVQPSPTPTPGRDVLGGGQSAADLPTASALAFWRVLPNSIQTQGAGWTAEVQVRVPTGSTYTFQIANGQSARKTRDNIDGDDFYSVRLGDLTCGQRHQANLLVVQNGRLRLNARNDDTFQDVPISINAPC